VSDLIIGCYMYSDKIRPSESDQFPSPDFQRKSYRNLPDPTDSDSDPIGSDGFR